MFNRYWRTYPWMLQIALAFLMIFTLMSFATLLTIVMVPKLTGVTIPDLVNLNGQSPAKTIRASLLAQAVNQIGTFMASALIFASLTHPRIREYLGLRLPGRPIHWLLVTGIMVGMIPVLLYGQSWMMKYIHLGQQADEQQQKTAGIFKAFLRLESGSDFVLLLSILAVLPAIGEELIFRGVFLRLFHRGFTRMSALKGNVPAAPDLQRSMVIPVIVSALLFAYWHTSPYDFAFIFIAGCVLALIYQLTGSLLCCMWAHFLYNGLQVAAPFLARYNATASKIVEGDSLPVIFPLVGFILFIGCFYGLIQRQRPLTADWSQDFRQGEEDGK